MKPWTLRELRKLMRAAGWEKLPGPGDTFRHPDGGKVGLLNWTPESGELWHHYAERHELPYTGTGDTMGDK